MRITRISLLLLLLPVMAGAVNFDRDLYFGLRNNPDVTKLQEFLRDQGLYGGPITGSFFTLTREAVKTFQAREKIVPALGYLGPKTRVRANTLLAAADTPLTAEALLTLKIAELQAKLQTLKEDLVKEKEAAVVPAVTTPPVITVPTPAPAPKFEAGKITITGSATSTFPAEMTPLKLHEFSIYNGSDSDVAFVNVETLISDDMDSLNNRGNKINLILRDGLTSVNALVSKTEFTFVTTVPKIGSPYLSPLTLPLGIVVKPGEERKITLWAEFLKYARAGTLKIESTKFNTTIPLSIVGSFSTVLTKEAEVQ